MRVLISVLVVVFFIIGCSNKDLDRGKAEKLISEFYEYPYVEIMKTRGLTLGQPTSGEAKLISDGFIISRKGALPSEYNYYLTDKGKAFLINGRPGGIYSVATNELEFNNITGIKILEGNKKAIVEFTEKRINITPFALLREKNNSEIVQNKVEMELYDSGWRITTVKPKLYRSNEFAGFN